MNRSEVTGVAGRCCARIDGVQGYRGKFVDVLPRRSTDSSRSSFRILLNVQVDVAAEARAQKEISRVEGEITKGQRRALQSEFRRGAPAAIVAQRKERIATFLGTRNSLSLSSTAQNPSSPKAAASVHPALRAFRSRASASLRGQGLSLLRNWMQTVAMSGVYASPVAFCSA